MTLPAAILPLFKAALKVRQHAYAPYSNFLVGACILADNDKLYAGANVENSAYPQSQCAEASAIGNMVSDGQKRIKAILVVATHDKFPSPCGGCRQRISEFASASTPVYLCNLEGQYREMTLAELLPHSFSAKDMRDSN